ncbi:MAG: SRPBCC family protein [Mycobacterium sp.]|nr:SRPBCC family protein [Mycobacterium sp.]
MKGRTDSARRSVDAPPSAVYRALVDPSALVQWLPPQGMTGQIHVYEPRPGGRFEMTLTYDQADTVGKTATNQDVIEAEFVMLSPDQKIVQRVVFKSDDPQLAGTMIMSWFLRAVDSGTEIRVVCENVPAGIDKQDHAEGLRSSLTNLANFLQNEPRDRSI